VGHRLEVYNPNGEGNLGTEYEWDDPLDGYSGTGRF